MLLRPMRSSPELVSTREKTTLPFEIVTGIESVFLPFLYRVGSLAK